MKMFSVRAPTLFRYITQSDSFGSFNLKELQLQLMTRMLAIRYPSAIIAYKHTDIEQGNRGRPIHLKELSKNKHHLMIYIKKTCAMIRQNFLRLLWIIGKNCDFTYRSKASLFYNSSFRLLPLNRKLKDREVNYKAFNRIRIRECRCFYDKIQDFQLVLESMREYFYRQNSVHQ